MANIQDIILKHQIFLQRVAKNLEEVAADAVSASDRKLIALLQKKLSSIEDFSPGRLSANQLAQLQKQVSEIRSSAIKLAENNFTLKARELAENESAFAGKLIKQEISPKVPLVPVTGQQLNNLIKYEIFSGNTLSQWFKGLESADLQRTMSTIRAGVAQGDTTNKIVRTLAGTAKANYTDGVLNISRNSARMIARTATNGISNSARMAMYSNNSDVIYAIVYSATLDSRTSPICRGLDGTAWRTPEELDQVQTPPMHPYCRSTLVPAPDKESIKTQRPAERENFEANAENRYNKKQKADGRKKRFKDLSQATRRRKILGEQKIYKRETGNNPFVLTKNTYEEFFNRQSASFQKEILGPTRYQLFKKGGMKLDKFTDFNNRDQFTIAELRKKDKEAFIKAGLIVDK